MSDIKHIWLTPCEDLPVGKTKQILTRKVVLAGAVFTAILLIVYGASVQLSSIVNPSEANQDNVSDAESWIQDIESYKARGNVFASIPQRRFEQRVEVRQAILNDAREEAPVAKPVIRAKHTVKERLAVVQANAVVATNDPWSQVYGSSGSDSKVQTMGYSESSSDSSSPSSSAETSGSRIQVRLKGSASSNPNGPVIAITTKPMRLGSVDIPKGSEIHGETNGSSVGARLLINFRYINVPGQPALKISGRAIDLDGRVGVQGRNLLGGGSDIAASTAGSTISATGSAIASMFSGPSRILGAAVEGAARPTARKADRLDHADSAVLVEGGARFQVYVDEVISQ